MGKDEAWDAFDIKVSNVWGLYDLPNGVAQELRDLAAACVAEAEADPLALIRDLVFWATHTPSGGEYRKKREVLEAAELLLAGKETKE